MDVHLVHLVEESRQLHSQSQANGVTIAALSSQLQEVVEAMGTNGRAVGSSLVELKSGVIVRGRRLIA